MQTGHQSISFTISDKNPNENRNEMVVGIPLKVVAQKQYKSLAQQML